MTDKNNRQEGSAEEADGGDATSAVRRRPRRLLGQRLYLLTHGSALLHSVVAGVALNLGVKPGALSALSLNLSVAAHKIVGLRLASGVYGVTIGHGRKSRFTGHGHCAASRREHGASVSSEVTRATLSLRLKQVCTLASCKWLGPCLWRYGLLDFLVR